MRVIYNLKAERIKYQVYVQRFSASFWASYKNTNIEGRRPRVVIVLNSSEQLRHPIHGSIGTGISTNDH